MLQDLREYNHILESFSKPLMDLITEQYLLNDGILVVRQTTHQYYKYIDYTAMAEYLFKCINKTLNKHFEKEIQFLVNYDKTKRAIQTIIDMPDKLIDLFIKFTIQNNGKLGREKKSKYFEKLSDGEINELQSIVTSNLLASNMDPQLH